MPSKEYSGNNPSILAFPVIAGFMIGMLVLNTTGLETKWIAATAFGLIIIAATILSGHFRPASLFFIILSLTVNFNYHLTYWPEHIGVPDGFTIETTDIFILAILLISAGNSTPRRDAQIPKSIIIFASLIFLANVFSLRNSLDYTLTTYGLVDHARAFILFILIASQIKTYEDLKIVLISLQACGLFIGALCILQATMQINFFEPIKEEYIDDNSIFRAAGLLTPTYTGGLLASLFPLIAIQLWLFKSRFAMLITTSVLSIVFIGLVLTLTRGALISLFVSIFFMILILAWAHQIKTKHTIAGIAIGIISMSLIWIYFHTIILDRLEDGMNNVVARQGLLLTAWEMIKDNPLSGIGLNNYTVRMDEYEPAHLIHDFRYIVHNRYILFLAETGILGLISFLLFFGAGLIICLRYASRIGASALSTAALGLLGAMIVTALHMNMEAYEGGKPFLYVWFLIGLCAALPGIEHHYKDVKEKKSHRLDLGVEING